LEKQGLRFADSDRGKFRLYLLGAMKHYMADELDCTRETIFLSSPSTLRKMTPA
jgi:hypothetical protein